jgi:hypothetical protein
MGRSAKPDGDEGRGMEVLTWLKGFFVLAPVQELRPDPESGEGRYVRSFLVMRLIIGLIGVLLPFALVFIDHRAFHGYPYPRGSESIYYYSGMREVFTVSIGTIAFFLFAYKLTERNLDNTLSFFAGLAAMLIPLFPTAPPALIQQGFTKRTNPVPPDLTPLQKAFTQRQRTRFTSSPRGSLSFVSGLRRSCSVFAKVSAESGKTIRISGRRSGATTTGPAPVASSLPLFGSCSP